MTLEEAVRWHTKEERQYWEELQERIERGELSREACADAVRTWTERQVLADKVFRAHAVRTLQVREAEPEQVTAYRNPDTRSWAHASYVLHYIDTLTAQNAALQAERDALRQETWLARMLTAMEVERDAERAAHDTIASLCFARGAESADGTSVAAVRDLCERFDALRARVEAVERLVNDYGYSLGMGADYVVTISSSDALALMYRFGELLDTVRPASMESRPDA